MRTFRFFAKRLFLTFLTLSSAFFFSCGHNDTPRIYIGDTFQYWEADADSTFGDAMKNTANFIIVRIVKAASFSYHIVNIDAS